MVAENESTPDARMAALLLDWFQERQRPLPWRAEYQPYHVLVAEFMLQQTQMERAAGFFTRFIEQFPTVQALAESDEDTVLKMWEGLGYYARARNLQRAAQTIVAEHEGRVPDTYEGLRALPGVGPYTAGAVLCQAYNQPYPAVDANVERVFSRVYDLDEPVKSKGSQRFIKERAEVLTPPEQGRDFAQALMELGALVCRKRPECEACPIEQFCESRRLGIVDERPVTLPARKIIPIDVATGVLVHEGKLFIQKRRPNQVWGGLWEFPGGTVEEGERPHEALVREWAEETEFAISGVCFIDTIVHGYTRYRVSLHCFFCNLNGGYPVDERGAPLAVLHEAERCLWVRPDDLAQYAFPAGHRKLIDRLLSEPALLRALRGE